MKAKDHARAWKNAANMIRDHMQTGKSHKQDMAIWLLASVVAGQYGVIAKEQEEQDG